MLPPQTVGLFRVEPMRANANICNICGQLIQMHRTNDGAKFNRHVRVDGLHRCPGSGLSVADTATVAKVLKAEQGK